MWFSILMLAFFDKINLERKREENAFCHYLLLLSKNELCGNELLAESLFVNCTGVKPASKTEVFNGRIILHIISGPCFTAV